MADQLQIERARAERADAGRKAAVARADTLEDRARKAEKQSRDLRTHLDMLAGRLAKAGDELDPLRNELRDAKAELASLRVQEASATASAETANEQLAQWQERAATAERERDQLRAERSQLLEQSTFYEQAGKESASALATASAAQVESEQRATELQSTLDQRHEEFRQERNRLSRDNERLQKQVDQLTAELERARTGLGGALKRRLGR